MTTTYGAVVNFIGSEWAGWDNAPGRYKWSELEAATGLDSDQLRRSCTVGPEEVRKALPADCEVYELLVEAIDDLEAEEIEVPATLNELREKLELRLADEAERQWLAQYDL